MSVKPTILFGMPQQEISSLLAQRVAQCSILKIVTGFATPGGLAAIAGPVTAQPEKLKAFVVGAATYPAFQALEDLLTAGADPSCLRVHLGHTAPTRGKHPFARFHPMLHSKIYYTEDSSGSACAIVGSHNVTSFALKGCNGEAAVMLEGAREDLVFEEIRRHIAEAYEQAVTYSPGLREAFAWWTRDFIDGMRAETRIPNDWQTARTILIFAQAGPTDRPRPEDQLYFEIPAGIQQIDSLSSETHLFLFDSIPPTPRDALNATASASASYKCRTLGADNKQGNKELSAHWRIDEARTPVLTAVPGAVYRPAPPAGKQQVRAEVKAPLGGPFEYQFDPEPKGWDPEFSERGEIHVRKTVRSEEAGMHLDAPDARSWRLVKGLKKRGATPESDQRALQLAAPESGSFILVSLRRRPLRRTRDE